MNKPSPQLVDRLGIEKLASLPQATIRLLRVCNDPDAELDTMAGIIRNDPGLTSRMLHVGSSPLYAQWGKIADLNRMLVVLGIDTIKTIAITSSMLEFFRKIQPARNRFVARFWHRSLLCALLSKEMAEKNGYANPEEAYLCGLLHKLGQLVLLNSDPEVYTEILKKQPSPGFLAQEERQNFGIDHVELGGWLVERWQLGGFIGDAILYQAEPPEQIRDAPDLVVLENLAAGLSDPQRRGDCMDDACALLRLERQDLEHLLASLEQRVKETAETFGVDIESEQADGPSVPQQDQGGADLWRVIHDATLLESAMAAMLQHSATQPPYPAIQAFLSIMFGIDQPLFFVKATGKNLQGQPVGEHDLWLEQIHIVLTAGRSLACDAFLQKKPLSTFQNGAADTPINVIDRQLIRRCGRSGLLALPLINGGKALAVVVAGVDKSTLDSLKPQSELLRLFLNRSAQLIVQRRKEEEQRLLQVANSRAEMIRSVRKIRHEANNPLGIVSNYLHILGAKLGEENPVQQELDIVQEEIARVSNILLGLTNPFDNLDTRPGYLDLNELISGLHSILKPSSFDLNGIDAELKLDPSVEPIEADKDKVKQLLVNLLKNAVEAMPDGGRISIGTRNNVLDEQGNHVEIRIKDSGPGLPESVRRNLFQPVSTTKGGGHSGLGLSICGQLARNLGGGIKCTTGPAGTEFTVVIPKGR